MIIILQGKYCHVLLMYFYAKKALISHIFINRMKCNFDNGKMINTFQFEIKMDKCIQILESDLF